MFGRWVRQAQPPSFPLWLGQAQPPHSAMASAGSATAENTATSQNSSEISATSNRKPITGGSMAVAEPAEATN